MTDGLLKLDRRHCIALTLAAAAWGCAAPALARTAEAARILVVGDSLSAEYGLKRDAGWVKLLEQRLAERRLPATVINASISGDTTAGGRSRLPALLQQHKPTHVVIELGANDALRGLPLKTTADNLGAMAQASRAIGAKVVIVGMQLPPNYGRRYGEEFAGLFKQVAADHQAALVPFFFKGVADVPDALRFFQADRIHPNEDAQPQLLDNVWPALEPLLRSRR